jgi:peptidoglycan/xylan/chitin deacetylase (PgdA/CDA1 family)
MQRRARPLRHSGRAALCAFVAALAAGGCAIPPPRPVAEPVAQHERGPVLAHDDELTIVIAAAGENANALAQRYLGDASKGWWIMETNGGGEIRPGQVVVIPLKARNPIGVYADGYQTIPILCYHRFGAKASKLTVTPAAFAAQMQFLAKNGYHVVPLARVDEFLSGRTPLPRKSVVITIDDGYRSAFEIAWPILKEHGFPATVFLYSDFVGAGDALNWAQMKEMTASGLVDVQPHSKTHANLTLRQADETDARYRERVRKEVDTPIGLIKERLSLPSTSFAYPYGDVNEIVVDLLARQGTQVGVTVTPGGNGFFAYPYMLRRNMVFGNEDLDAFKAKLNVFVRTAGR